MTQDASTRLKIMGDVLGVISTQGYRYNLSKGFSGWANLPPPAGTEINCQAAANLAKRLAEEQYGLEGDSLQVVSVKPKGGFIVVASPGQKALGTTGPTVDTPQLKCWEFDNHFRVKDPKGFNKVYDPIFGSSGASNPTGIGASKTYTGLQKIDGKDWMVTEYGEKYKVMRCFGAPARVEVLKAGAVTGQYLIDDSKFT